jgi:hypothetical protein
MGGFDRDYSALCASPFAMLRAALSGVLQRVASQSGRRAGVTLWAAVAGRGQEPEWLDQTMDTPPLVAVLLAGSATLGATSHVNVDRLA